MANDPFLRMLGLARRAGKLAFGDELVREMCLDKKARCVFVAADAGASTAKKAAFYAERANVPLVTLPHGKDELGAAIGKHGCALCAVSDIGLVSSALNKLAGEYEQYAALAAQVAEKNARIQSRRGKKKPKERTKPAQGQPAETEKRPAHRSERRAEGKPRFAGERRTEGKPRFAGERRTEGKPRFAGERRAEGKPRFAGERRTEGKPRFAGERRTEGKPRFAGERRTEGKPRFAGERRAEGKPRAAGGRRTAHTPRRTSKNPRAPRV